MSINYNYIIKFLIILAVVFTTACNDNDKNARVEILKIDEIWSDNVPDGILPEPNSMKRRRRGINYLLIPSHISKNEDINIKMYGCWNSDNTILNSCETFNSFKSSIKENKVSLVVKKNVLDKDCKVLQVIHYLSFKKEYNITNNFEVGDIEIVVKNPDGEKLTHVITVE